jgi:hypothetical protein
VARKRKQRGRPPVRTLTVTTPRGNLSALRRALQLSSKGGERWRPLKGSSGRYRARCPKCACAALEVISGPIQRKHRVKTAHRRRTLIKCLICGANVTAIYGGTYSPLQ